jgi:hypothetical protein
MCIMHTPFVMTNDTYDIAAKPQWCRPDDESLAALVHIVFVDLVL